MRDPSCPFKSDDLQPRGSRWLLANFHTHTPGSSDWSEQQRPTTRAEQLKYARGILDDCLARGVSVLAVTDHNSPSFVLEGSFADPVAESYYGMMRRLAGDKHGKYGRLLILPGVEIGAENIHVLGIFPPGDDPGWDVMKIASMLAEGNCPPEFFGDANKSCTDFSVADAIDAVHARGGIAIPAHIDQASGFLKEEDQPRLLKLIVSRPHLFAVEYKADATRVRLERLISDTRWKDLYAARGGRSFAWTQSSDSHFVHGLPGTGHGVAIGTESRRTWLRLDPDDLTFEAVRAALLDPENRVRVDRTRSPRNRQAEHRELPASRTYVRAMRLDWEDGEQESVRFNLGVNAMVGPSGAGKTSRARAFSVIAGKREDMAIAPPRVNADGTTDKPPTLRSIDLMLSRGAGETERALWWLHRDSEAAASIYLSRVEAHGDGFRAAAGGEGAWINLLSDGVFDSKALRHHLEEMTQDRELAPSVPRAFSLLEMEEMLRDQTRLARFIAWHYTPAKYLDAHRAQQQQLRELLRGRHGMTPAQLSSSLLKIMKALRTPRRKAHQSLASLYQGGEVRLRVSWSEGLWTDRAARLAAARALLALDSSAVTWPVLEQIEDRATVALVLDDKERLRSMPAGCRINTALRGMLLVLGAGDIGPVVLDAPGAYFEPADLVSTLAPLLLSARDEGAQVVAAIDDTNLPFAVDADLLMVCRRSQKEGYIHSLDDLSTGGLDKSNTALWALDNLDGGGAQFDRRKQFYLRAVKQQLAKQERTLAGVYLKLHPAPKKEKDG